MANNKTRRLPNFSPEVLIRFWKNVDTSAGPDGCWPWLGNCFNSGYGRFNALGDTWYANRIALFLVSGQDPGPMMACHSCDNRPCCNGKHLFPGTNQENTADSVLKERRAYGDRNGSRKYPERLRQGPRPECGLKGEKNKSSKLTEANIHEIRRLYANGGTSQQRIAGTFHVSQVLISAIVRREIWSHI